jgi:hypothetical protein
MGVCIFNYRANTELFALKSLCIFNTRQVISIVVIFVLGF